MSEFIQSRLDKVLTQYRESEKLLSVSRAIMEQVEAAIAVVRDVEEAFNIDTAVGEQLTFLGRRLGWPREHCICAETPVFGFDCGKGDPTIVGFCEPLSGWAACNVSGFGLLSIDDDEVYRKMLRVRVYQTLGLFELPQLLEASQIIWPNAVVLDAGNGRVVIGPMVEDIDVTDPLLQLWPRILPVALGVEVLFHFGTRPVWGFGEGWGNIADCGEEDFLATEEGDLIGAGNGLISTESEPIIDVSDWLCPVNTVIC